MYYVVGCNFVAGVIVRDGIIIGAAPILGRFKGQPLTNLHRWNRILTITKLPGEHTHGTQQD
jgi:hypothetical protein